jgi:hypothetical protein
LEQAQSGNNISAALLAILNWLLCQGLLIAPMGNHLSTCP